MRKIFIVSSILFIQCLAGELSAYAKKYGIEKVDSLVSELYGTDNDIERVKLALLLSAQYVHINPDVGVKYALQAKEISELQGWDFHLANAWLQLGSNYLVNSEFETAARYLNLAEGYFEQSKEKSQYSESLWQQGNLQWQLSNLECALNYYQKAIDLGIKNRDLCAISRALFRSSEVQRLFGNEAECCWRSTLALLIAQSTGNRELLPYTLLQKGLAEGDFYQYPQTPDFYNEALNQFQALGYKEYAAHTLLFLAAWYVNMENFALAKKVAGECIKMGVENKSGGANFFLGIVAIKALKLDSALWYFDKLRESKFYLKNSRSKARFDSKIAESLINYFTNDSPPARHANLNKRTSILRNCRKNLNEAIMFQEKINSRRDLLNSYEYMARTYEMLGDTKRSLVYYKLHKRLLEQMKTPAIKRDFNEWREKFAAMETRAESRKIVSDLENRLSGTLFKNQTKYYALIGLLLMMMIFGGLSWYLYKRMKKRLIMRNCRTEISKLSSQLNPHFVFNALNSIYDYVQNSKMDKAGHFVADFSKLIRLVLENSRKEFITIASEIEILQLYLSLEHSRYEGSFEYKIKVDDHIDIEAVLIPPMMLQPLVENALVHGISREVGGLINITICKEADLLLCCISDNGSGFLFRKERQIGFFAYKKFALGVKLIREKLEVLNLVMQTQGSIEVLENPGRQVNIRIPYVDNAA